MNDDELRAHKGTSFVGITTSFMCHDGQGEFVMSRRSQNARDEQGTWEIGGGGLKWGNTAEATARREVEEEYGATILGLEFLGYRDIFRKLADGTPTHWVGIDFAILVDRKTVKINEPDMIDDLGWFTLELLPTPLHSQQKPFFQKYEKQLKRILKAH